VPREIGVGLLGTGFAGRAHATAIWDARRIGDVIPRPVAVYSKREEKAKNFAERFGFEKFYTDWRELINDPDVEVVINALPNYEHRDPIVESARAGKHVLTEKPLGRSLGEALEIYREVRKAGIQVGVGFNHRWLPAVQLMSKFVKQGMVGDVIYFRGAFLEDWAFPRDMPFAWRFDVEKAGYGVIGDNGSHVIDLALFLVGNIARVSAVSRTVILERKLPSGERAKVTNDDITSVLVEFESGVTGVIESARVLPGRTNYMSVEVYGDRGAVFFDLERPDELYVVDYREDESWRGVKKIRVLERSHRGIKGFWAKHSLGWHSSFAIQLSEFLKAIVMGESFRPDIVDGVRVNAVLDAIVDSARTGKWTFVVKIVDKEFLART